MRNFIGVLCFFLGLSMATSPLLAQKTLTNGTITYELEIESDQPEAAMLNGSLFNAAFNGGLAKFGGSIAGGLIAGKMLLSDKEKAGLTIFDMMGQGKAVRISNEEYKGAENDFLNNLQVDKIKFDKGTKKIAGYKCKKAVIPGNNGEDVTVYISDKIKPTGNGFVKGFVEAFEGFPLGFEVSAQGNKISIMATEVSTTAPSKSEFDMTIPDGYEETTWKELGSQGGGGAMPFGG